MHAITKTSDTRHQIRPDERTDLIAIQLKRICFLEVPGSDPRLVP